MSDKTPETLTPPAYNTLNPTNKEAIRNERYWDNQRPRNWTSNSKHNLVFTLNPVPQRSPSRWSLSQIFRKEPKWHAKLMVCSKNIPRLMLQGFHWSPAGIIPAAGHLQIEANACVRAGGEHFRTYKFVDGPDISSEWCSTLEVFSKDPSVLTNFDLDWITKDMVTKVEASNWEGEKVYVYEKDENKCFNTIYEKMPMEGWWPWPKVSEEGDSPEKDGGEEINGKAKFKAKKLAKGKGGIFMPLNCSK